MAATGLPYNIERICSIGTRVSGVTLLRRMMMVLLLFTCLMLIMSTLEANQEAAFFEQYDGSGCELFGYGAKEGQDPEHFCVHSDGFDECEGIKRA